MPDHSDQAFWDERYRSSHTLWSGNPNPHLVDEAGGLAPGRALDAGAGEGADAIWLAQGGWEVTAVDVSPVALERAGGHAERAGAEVAGRIRWLRQDMVGWEPGPDTYDLVSAHYLHLPTTKRQPLFARLASAVAAGGTLLIVGHHPSDLQTTMPRPPIPELYFTGDDLMGQLDPDRWEVVTNTAVGRVVADPEGRAVTIHDTVLRARLRSDQA